VEETAMDTEEILACLYAQTACHNQHQLLDLNTIIIDIIIIINIQCKRYSKSTLAEALTVNH